MVKSTSNGQVKNIIQLQKKTRVRRQQGLFVTEGIRMFREAPEELISGIYVSESFSGDPQRRKLLEGRRYEVLSDPVFSRVSDTKTPQGILCLMKMPDHDPARFLEDIAPGSLWLVLENVQDPGNLGAMFRTGEGAGISGVIMDRNTVDIYNPKTIRSTMGSVFRVPFSIADSLPDAVNLLKKRGIRTYGAHLEGSVCYDEPDYTGGAAFLIGNEGNGLTEELAALADQKIHIPMEGRLESLNAAMAAGILMYEASRQKRRR